MLKKASIITLGLAVAIAPGVAAAEENTEQQSVVDTASEEQSVDNVEVDVPDSSEEDGQSQTDNSTTTNGAEDNTSEVDEANPENNEETQANEQAPEQVEDNETTGDDSSTEEEKETSTEGDSTDEETENDEEETEQQELSNEEIVAEMEGIVAGQVSEYDKEKGYYTLDIKANITNHSSQSIADLYTAVDIPEDIMILDSEETPEGIEILHIGEGDTALAIPVGQVEAGKTKSISISIPVIGKTSAGELGDNIIATLISPEGYEPIGEITGSTSIDYSSMNQATYFEGKAQAVTDFPGLAENQFGMQFGFRVQNLTIEDIDNVKIEYIVPDGVTIHEPDGYKEGDIPDALDNFLDGGNDLSSSSLKIDWNGNTANVDIGSLASGSGYQGFFSAVGESSLDFNKIKDLKVKISLFKGDQEISSYTTPIELVKHQGNDGDSENDNNNGGTTPIVNKPGTDSSPKDNSGDNNGNVKDSKDKKDDDKITVTPVDNKDNNSEQGGKLPNTAGTNPVGALMGGAIAAFGAAILAVRKRLFQ